MSFHLSPASLVDQYGKDSFSFISPPGIALPNGTHTLQHLVPQIYIVNPASDNIFRHVDSRTAHTAIVGLIYCSMWMGALGWDIVSTIPFDIRLLRETKWTNAFPAIYSIAYLLSRYVSLAWLVTAVTNSVIMTTNCDAWMKGSTALFSVAISATTLVFCLRTCSIWHMQQRIVTLVVTSWVLVVAFSILLPIMSYGSQLPTSSFCSWHFNGLYVVGVFSAVLLFDLLCLVLTVCKLNKAGWRGMLRGLFPSTQHNLDAEDVKTMLVQKTTAFFAIQFVFLVTALLVYVLTHNYAYRMMNLLASVAVAASMAGRIFRRAWRQTRELAPHNINRPPSYYPAWTEGLRGAEHNTRPQTANTGDSTNAHTPRPLSSQKDDDSAFHYVEGEFGPKPKATSPGIVDSTHVLSAAQAYASHQLSAMEAGQGPNTGGNAAPGNPVMISRQDRPVSSRPSTAGVYKNGSEPPAPAYTRREGSLSRPTTGEQDRTSLVRISNGDETLVLSAIQARRRGTTDSLVPSHLSSGIPFANLTGSLRSSQSSRGLAASSESLSTAWSRRLSAISLQSPTPSKLGPEADSLAMEEKRRRYIASPPLSAGAKLNSKEESRKVYDVDSVKAAAKLEAYPRYLGSSARPMTASSASRSFADSDGTIQRPNSGTRSPGDSSRTGSARGVSISEPRRPKTAPSSWSARQNEEVGRQHDAVETSEASAGDDALVAFLQTVDQDSRIRVSEAQFDQQSPLTGAPDEERPRTSRGATASSRDEEDAALDSDHSTITGRSLSRPRTSKRISRRTSVVDPGRPSTAVGSDEPRPFGYGVLAPNTDIETTDTQGELGSVIHQQYVMLAAQAGMPLEPPS